MHLRKVRPAEEEFADSMMMVIFSAVWYGLLLREILGGNGRPDLFMFLFFGILPAYTAYGSVRQVLFYRKRRRTAILTGSRYRGRIQRITIQKEPYHLRRGQVQYRKRYYLIVERTDISTGIRNEIKSSPYRVPLPYYLTSREVTLYCDSTGWNWYIEDLKCSFFRQKNVEIEVDDYGDGGYTGQNIFRIVFIVGILWIFVSELFH